MKPMIPGITQSTRPTMKFRLKKQEPRTAAQTNTTLMIRNTFFRHFIILQIGFLFSPLVKVFPLSADNIAFLEISVK